MAEPEQESQEARIIKDEWNIWNDMLSVSGKPDEDGVFELEYNFLVDRRLEEESIFTGDEVLIATLKKPLEEWTTTPGLHSDQGEKWIIFRITPRDPLHPRIGDFSQRNQTFYFVDSLNMYISNKGRGYESVEWNNALEPDVHKTQNPSYSYLKKYPKPEEITDHFKEEPEEVFIEPFEPLKGKSLERLDFLKVKLQRGEVIND